MAKCPVKLECFWRKLSAVGLKKMMKMASSVVDLGEAVGQEKLLKSKYSGQIVCTVYIQYGSHIKCARHIGCSEVY